MRDGGVPFLPPEQGVSEVSTRARETTMFQGEVASPLPVAEEGSESARQAPVFYEGIVPMENTLVPTRSRVFRGKKYSPFTIAPFPRPYGLEGATLFFVQISLKNRNVCYNLYI